jgi:(1->4)-alpha-D-glucan 1-alpha-D-glucosylmutase
MTPSPEVNRAAQSPRRIPTATYRLQFNADFPLTAARALVPYLHDLGVSDVYASPLLAARPGSMHGYDVVDYGRLNPEIGTEEELHAFARALQARGMGLILDVVPNHMCMADPANQWWADVLENGPGSPYASFFDIDWHPPKPDLRDKVLLPILGDQYGRVLEHGDLRVEYHDGAFTLRYGEVALPLAPKTWGLVLEPVVDDLRQALGDTDRRLLELESILTGIAHLPPRTETDADRVRERQREKEIIKQRLHILAADSDVDRVLRAVLRTFNGTPGEPHSFDRLEAMLAEQAYRLSFWRVATDEINYRRFFDINELAATRVEEPEVFAAVHQLSFGLAREGLVTGLRIDHIDGLLDPAGYLEAVQRALTDADGTPFYLVVEKILTAGERLDATWPVAGTTGYDFLALANGAGIDPDGMAQIDAGYRQLTGIGEPFADQLCDARRLVLQVSMSSELTVLARRLDRISEQHRFSRDFTLDSLQQALGEIIAAFPVYRSYIRPADDTVRPRDQLVIERAVAEATRRNPAVSASIFRFIGDVLLLRDPDGLEPAQRAARRDFVLRAQQLTAPVMAKGLEDTAFYRYYPLAALNEVGGSPGRAPATAAAFHAASAERRHSWPHTLLASSTHDTKRSEDVRARLANLADMPGEWQRAVERWREMNRPHRRAIGDDGEAPDANEEYLLYQTLLGMWPSEAFDPAAVRDRVQAYMRKALREAKLHTSWINPNDAYEEALTEFIDAALDPDPANAFLADLLALQRRLVAPGAWTSVAQLLLKITAPGVPDFYQGSERWRFDLVDPDNRRPVAYDRSAMLLAELQAVPDAEQAELARRLADEPTDDRLKLYVTTRALTVRRAMPQLFAEGDYVALGGDGPRARHLLAFARVHEGRSCLVVTTRFHLALGADRAVPAGAVWRDTSMTVPGPLGLGPWTDAFTGRAHSANAAGTLHLEEVFSELPVALLRPT